MTSILITSSDKTEREALALQVCQNYEIDKLDITIVQTEGAIGIEDIRKLQQKLLLKPLRGAQKAAILHNAQMLTIEAQNAFLKILEEPPDNTSIILTASNQEAFLPTIISRCKVIALAQKAASLSEGETQELDDIFTTIQTASIGKKLLLAQKAGEDKEKALAWLEKAIIYLRDKMLEAKEESPQYIVFLEEFQSTYITIKTTNVNPRFALENLFLFLSS